MVVDGVDVVIAMGGVVAHVVVVEEPRSVGGLSCGSGDAEETGAASGMMEEETEEDRDEEERSDPERDDG